MGRKPYLRLEWNEPTNMFVESVQRSAGDTQFSESAEAFQESNVKGVVDTIRQRIEQSSGIKKTQDRVVWIWINILIVVFGYAAGFVMMLRKHYMWAIIFLGGAPMVSFIIITYRSLVKDRWDQVNKWLDRNEGWILEISRSAGLAVSWFFAKEGEFLIILEVLQSPQECTTTRTSCFSKKTGVYGYVIFTFKTESRAATLGSRRSIEKELVTSAQKPIPNMVKPSSSGEVRPKFLKSKFDPKQSSAPQQMASLNEMAKVVTTRLPVGKPSNSPPNNPLKPKSLMLAALNGDSANKLLPNSSSRQLGGESLLPTDPRRQTGSSSIRPGSKPKPSNSRRPSVQRQPSQQQAVEVLKPSLHKPSNLQIPRRESDERLPSINQDESWDGSQALEDESANQSRVIGFREEDPSQRDRNTLLVTDFRERNDSIDNFVKFFQDQPYQSQSNMAEPAVSVGQGSTKETSQPTAGMMSKGSSSKLRLNPTKQSSAPVEGLPSLKLPVQEDGALLMRGVSQLQQPSSSARKILNKHLPKPGISVNRESMFSTKDARPGASVAN